MNPHAETVSKTLGTIRLDPSASIPVPNALITSNQYAFKALFKGSAIDLDLIDRLTDTSHTPFDKYVKSELKANVHLGYKPRGKKLTDASDLANLPALETDDDPVFEVKTSLLKTVRSRYPALMMERPRLRTIYKGPLILFREAPKEAREMRGAIWCPDDVAFCFSYYGISVDQGAIGEYLFVLSYSDLFFYWALLTSAKLGVEREKMYLEDIRNFPIAPYAELSKAQQIKCQMLANQIRAGECPWIELEALVKTIYRLSDLDWQLISDALTFASPYSQSLKRAAMPIDERSQEVTEFVEEVNASLNELLDDSFTVRPMTVSPIKDWVFVEVSKGVNSHGSNTVQSDAALLASQLADEKSFWTTQLRMQLGTDRWLIGQPSQARYWSKSKARLLALQLEEAGLFALNAERG